MFKIPSLNSLKLLSNLIKTDSFGVRYYKGGKYIPKKDNEIYPTGNTVYEPYGPGEFPEDESLIPTKREVKEGFKIFKEECGRVVDEIKDWSSMKHIMSYEYDKVYRVFSFGRGEDPASWFTYCDQDEGYGYSECSFKTSKNGCAVFSGNLSTQFKPDGMTYRSGFCAIRAPKPTRTFGRKGFYDWTQYTHLVMRVRGDGRSYMINLGASGYFDISWYNSHNYALFTRGGPYWQVSKIPFSKFILTHKGYIQDKQWAPFQDEITWFGITLMDSLDGPFHLEIDYIGLEMSGTHDEIHSYETYKHVNRLADN